MIPIHPEALEALTELRSLCPTEKPLVFFKGVTQINRFRKDLALAEIDALDARSRNGADASQ